MFYILATTKYWAVLSGIWTHLSVLLDMMQHGCALFTCAIERSKTKFTHANPAWSSFFSFSFLLIPLFAFTCLFLTDPSLWWPAFPYGLHLHCQWSEEEGGENFLTCSVKTWCLLGPQAMFGIKAKSALSNVCARAAMRDGSKSSFVIIHCCWDWLCNRAPVKHSHYVFIFSFLCYQSNNQNNNGSHLALPTAQCTQNLELALAKYTRINQLTGVHHSWCQRHRWSMAHIHTGRI